MKPAPAIEINDLSVRFDGKTVIDTFSMCIEPGEKVIITGKSGSGKSTILRSILGFIIPYKGAIRIENELLTGKSVWKLRTCMAYVAQEPELGTGLAGDILSRPFSYRANLHLKGSFDNVPELMERLLLPNEILNKDIAALSGGEKQRIAIICAILLDRGIILLDEASSALDKAATLAILELLDSKKMLTVLSVSHDDKWLSFSDRIIELRGGSTGI
ncbi:MAG: hypothetical protein B1H11_08420 [Desulfobacteraceae bacterium 4484_190.1]|nr:ABC transporter ATP-binding protein [Deltaproteobacteria bacterium]OPX35950.1 MAG: hypothetical protein B1H11_08420 [Desulfobacteraceae bacterium 4484_190.1]